ncbi:hypothetical protein OK351_10780 [Glutamicibacter sp. MNS18]|uniref:hypothetical protein n=1 Tax=Glutamicibacter sp. MNS18 TaxID=2989817 RepID=UPI002235B963|nr:hypothetical protein [Glutamicibacter sp. MNS18]MCW4465990.1 hypothetical protein [Glutamicibacter sp. MNS18]
MGKLGILRTIGLLVAVALIALGVAGLAQILSGPTQRDLGPGIVVDQQFAPPQEDPTTGDTGSPTAPEESAGTMPQDSRTPEPTETRSSTPAATTAPESTRSQGPVKPLPPKSPKVYVDDDDDWDDDDDDDDDDWDDDDDDDD